MFGSEKLVHIPFDSNKKEISQAAIQQAKNYIDMINPNIDNVIFYESDNINSNKKDIKNKLEPQNRMRSFIEQELKSVKTREKYCSTFSKESYNNALKDINKENLSIKDSCKNAAFIISISETLME